MKVRIKGYKIFKDEVSLSFSGMTLIKGQSNNGKTSILTAIYTALSNERGNYFINNESNESVVEIEFDDKNKVLYRKKRTSSGGSSSYVLIKDGVKKNLDKSIPNLFDELDYFKPIVLNNDKIRLNFINQFEAPILLRYSKSLFYTLLVNVIASSLNNIKLALKKDTSVKESELNNVIFYRDSLLSKMSELNSEINKLEISLPPKEEYDSYLNKLVLYEKLVELSNRYFVLKSRLEELDILILYFNKRLKHVLLNEFYNKYISLIKLIDEKESLIFECLISKEYLVLVNRRDILFKYSNKLFELVKSLSEIESFLSCYSLYLNKLKLKLYLNKYSYLFEKLNCLKYEFDLLFVLYKYQVLLRYLVLVKNYIDLKFNIFKLKLNLVDLNIISVKIEIKNHTKYVISKYNFVLDRYKSLISDIEYVRNEIDIYETRVRENRCVYCGNLLK